MPLFLHLKKIKNGVKNEMKVKEYKQTLAKTIIVWLKKTGKPIYLWG